MTKRILWAAALAGLIWKMVLPGAGAGAAALVISPDMQFSYAQGLYEDKDFVGARVEFKRFVHFFSQDQRTAEAEFKTAMALYQLKEYHRAARGFNRIILKGREDAYTRESYFMQSRAFLCMGNAGYAQLVLQNYLKLTDDLDLKDRIYLELARIHIRQTVDLGPDGLDQAEKYLTLISPVNRADKNIESTLSAVERAQNAPGKNPTLSGVLAIVPGGGFLYCRRYKDAFVAFCLNTGLIYGAYTAFDHGNPALGGVTAFVGSGFYAGSIYGSVSAAHKYNRAQKIRLLGREFTLDTGLDPRAGSYVFSLSHPF